jgi:hypothetical protein
MGGLQLPKTLIQPDPLNPRGFWESEVFLKLHRRILAACRSDLTDVLPLPDGWLASAPVQQLEVDLERALASEFGDASRCLIKDPRICRLFPIWQRILDRLGWEYRVIIPARHPAEVVGSMKHQGKAAGLRGQLAWLQGFLAAEYSSRGVRRSFITFDQLLEDPVRHATRLSDELSLKLEFGEAVRSQIRDFLSHRPRNRVNELVRDRQILPMCRAAFNWAQAQAGGASNSVRIERVQMRYRMAMTVFGPVLRAKRRVREVGTGRKRARRKNDSRI